MKENQLAELRAKHPNSSPEEIEALHASLYPETVSAHSETIAVGEVSTAPAGHPDTSAENAKLEAARKAAPKSRKKNVTSKSRRK